MPVYNTPLSFLTECLESVKASNIKSLYEVIIVNDGSTDLDVVSFLNNYKDGLTKIIHKENGGVSSARNVGLKNAGGEYVICLDSDDLLLKEINNAIIFLENNKNYDLLYCDVPFFGDTKYIAKKREFSLFRLLYISNFLTPSCTLFRKSIVEKILFNEDLSYSEDKDFFARIAYAGYRFKYLPTPFCRYRKLFNGQSLSQKRIGHSDYVENFIKNQFESHKIINLYSVNSYVIENFTKQKSNLIKLILIIHFPRLFEFLLKRKVFKNNFVVD